MAQAKMRASGVVLTPIDPANALPGEMFRDENNADALTDKDTGGDEVPIGASSSDAVMTKLKQNKSGVTIAINSTVALITGGGIRKADSDAVDGQIIIGIALEEILDDAIGNVALIGPNAKNAVQGLGFSVAAPIYLNEDGSNRGFTDNAGSFTGDNDSIVRIGYADCAAGAASATADDLIMFASVEARP